MDKSTSLCQKVLLNRTLVFETNRWFLLVPGLQDWAQCIIPFDWLRRLYDYTVFKEEHDNMPTEPEADEDQPPPMNLTDEELARRGILKRLRKIRSTLKEDRRLRFLILLHIYLFLMMNSLVATLFAASQIGAAKQKTTPSEKRFFHGRRCRIRRRPSASVPADGDADAPSPAAPAAADLPPAAAADAAGPAPPEDACQLKRVKEAVQKAMEQIASVINDDCTSGPMKVICAFWPAELSQSEMVSEIVRAATALLSQLQMRFGCLFEETLVVLVNSCLCSCASSLRCLPTLEISPNLERL